MRHLRNRPRSVKREPDEVVEQEQKLPLTEDVILLSVLASVLSIGTDDDAKGCVEFALDIISEAHKALNRR